MQIHARLLYSRKITGTEDGGSEPNSVMIFLMYSGGVKSYRMLTMFKLWISRQPSRILLSLLSVVVFVEDGADDGVDDDDLDGAELPLGLFSWFDNFLCSVRSLIN